MKVIGNQMYGYRDDALAPVELESLSSGVLGSPHVGVHQLSGAFGTSRGCSIAFRRDGISALLAEMPSMAPYLRDVLRPSCNAFYLNPLVIDDGSAVAPHIDCSLSKHAKMLVHPRLVSVLYLEVPSLENGEADLVLSEMRDGAVQEVARVTPRSNRLVFFRGDLTHEVTRGPAGTRRASLVCEQYQLGLDVLPRIPTFLISSAKARRSAMA